MTEFLEVGKEFKSFDALQEAVHKYEQACFAQLSRTDSRTIENEESRRGSKVFNPDIKYSFVTFTCAFGGKPYVSRSTGIRNSKPRIKCNCPVILKCFASADGQKLVVRHSTLDCHNHDTSEESFKALPRGRLLDEETELEIFNLIESHENKKLARKLIKEKLIEETGRDITYKDIQNIEKRMSRKRDQTERNGHSDDEDQSYEDSMVSDQEEAGVKEEKSGGQKKGGDDAGKNDDDEASPEKKTEPAVKKEKIQKVQNTPKKRGRPPANAQAKSSGRPKREIREPTRFRDPSVTVSSSVLKRRASDSENSFEDSDSGSEMPKKELQSGRRGRKPAAKRGRKSGQVAGEGSSDEGSDGEQSSDKRDKVTTSNERKKTSTKNDSDATINRQLDLEERRLKIQEEMLTLQRQSMLLLKTVVDKLDRVEANQKGDAAAVSTEEQISTTVTEVQQTPEDEAKAE